MALFLSEWKQLFPRIMRTACKGLKSTSKIVANATGARILFVNENRSTTNQLTSTSRGQMTFALDQIRRACDTPFNYYHVTVNTPPTSNSVKHAHVAWKSRRASYELVQFRLQQHFLTPQSVAIALWNLGDQSRTDSNNWTVEQLQNRLRELTLDGVLLMYPYRPGDLAKLSEHGTIVEATSETLVVAKSKLHTHADQQASTSAAWT